MSLSGVDWNSLLSNVEPISDMRFFAFGSK